MKTYFAIVHEDRGSAVGVVFPDLPGCFSAGDTFDEAIGNASKALRLYAEAELSAGRKLPRPRTFDELYRHREIREEAKGAPFVGIQFDGDTRRAESKRTAKSKSSVSRPGRLVAGKRGKRAIG
jgi:predicted RNase H-like HicB family nuclease